MMNLVKVKNLTKVVMMCSTLGLMGCNAVGLGGTAKDVESAVSQLPDTNQQLDMAFEQYSEAFIERFWQLNPTYAIYVGYYKYDDRLPVPNELERTKHLNMYRAELKALAQFNVDQLSPRYASDYYILKNQLESAIWFFESLKSGSWDPSNYNVAGGFGVILNTDYKPLNDRLKTIIKRMANIPAYYKAAANNLTSPTVTHTKLGIQQNKGALGLFEGAIKDQVQGSDLSAQDKAEFDLALQKTSAAINGYIQHLEQLLPKLKADPKTRDFRIGKKLYDKKFELDIFSGYTAKQLFDKAVSEKARVHDEMAKIADTLWPKYFPNKAAPSDELVKIKALIDHISVKHVKRDEFVASIREQIPELEAFVLKNNLIAMDKDKPLVVRETPKYQRGFAGASINAPGPYDATANTYYNVTPLDNMDDAEAESYLREYNHWLLQILNIHEAVPGHYTQLVHSNKSKSLVKAIFGNGAMIEGWAVYTERMMLEQGYGDFEPELWLMYYKWNLRVIMNSILDYSIQVLGIDEKQAMDMMVNQAFQEQAEAQGKWRRATLSQVQLTSYFTGYSEIYQLREDLKKATGDKFSLVDFHNQFLSYGSAPVPIIRKLMFDDYVASHK